MELNHEKHRYEELADFLKTRRAKVSPLQVGLTTTTRRRTPGLRREEVAQLAGVSITWYTWLEQGRSIHVSAQVIESLSRVLLLDKQERIHLYMLANQPLPSDIPSYQETVSPILQNVLDSLLFSPSLIIDQRWNVIAWNKAACCIFGDFQKMNNRERNIVWSMFLNPKNRNMFVDWDERAKDLIGKFRSTCAQYIEDSWFIQFIEELKQESVEFSQWWLLHDIQSNSEVNKQLIHPTAGILDFEVSKFEVADNSGLILTIHTPLSGTDTTIKMKKLLNSNKC